MLHKNNTLESKICCKKTTGKTFQINDLQKRNCGFQKKRVEKKINKINDLRGYLTYPWKCGIIVFEELN